MMPKGNQRQPNQKHNPLIPGDRQDIHWAKNPYLTMVLLVLEVQGYLCFRSVIAGSQLKSAALHLKTGALMTMTTLS
jgi:hypothetical protein